MGENGNAQVLGVGQIHSNTPQSMGIKCMKGGGTCTPVQPYVSGTRGTAHPGES